MPLRSVLPPVPSPIPRLATGALLLAFALALAGCDKSGQEGAAVAAAPASAPAASQAAAPARPAYADAFYNMMATRRPSVPAMAALGKALFFDPALSASGRLACASCHSPAHAYGPANDLSVQLGGP